MGIEDIGPEVWVDTASVGEEPGFYVRTNVPGTDEGPFLTEREAEERRETLEQELTQAALERYGGL